MQHLVGVDRQPGERRGQDQQRHLQRDHAAVGERLDRQVALAERAEVAQAREHGQALTADQHVDQHDRHSHDRGHAQRANEPPANAGTPAGAEHGQQQREQAQRVEQDQRGGHQRQRPNGGDARSRRVQGTRDAAIEEQPADHRPFPGRGSASVPPALTATAKRCASAGAANALAARETPAASVPVTAHTGASSPERVAAIRPAPPASVCAGPPCSSSSVSVVPDAEKRAYTPLARGPSRSSRTSEAPAMSRHVPTATRSVSDSPAPLPSAATAAGTCCARRRVGHRAARVAAGVGAFDPHR